MQNHELTSPSENTAQPEQERGNWFHRNRWFTKEPLSYTGYQFVRSMLATIPYGFGMAGVLHLFGLASRAGVKMGLSAEGQKQFYESMKKVDDVTHMAGGAAAGIKKAVDVYSEAERAVLHNPGTKAMIGRNLVRLTNSPLNAALQIGLAFSMFRFTGGLVKGLRDKVMDEKNTAADTERETKNWWQTIKDMARVNVKAEAAGTFYGALTLGFIGALVHQTMPYKRINGETLLPAIKRVLSKPSKLLQNGMIWAISYSTFFEVDERWQKDIKLRQGNWKGSANSLVNGPNIAVGEPPNKETNGREKGQEDHKPGEFFTHDPGIPRYIFRRLLPVAVGIAGYAIMKRSTYVLAGGQMRPVTDEIKTLGQHAKLFLGNAWREGLATGTFGILWMATDAWGTWYDKFFEKMQHKESHTPVTEHQHRKYEQLLDRVNAKEQGAHRVA